MIFRETPLAGAFTVDLEPAADARGMFARTWCAREFAQHGLKAELVQSSISYNRKRGTVRGMHLQLPPSQEAKLLRCGRGAIFDVIVDLRPGSPTFMRHYCVELTASSRNALYIPPLMAHGFQTLADDTEVNYQMTDYYAPGLGFGFRWDDPGIGIQWPISTDVTIVPRDAGYPDFNVAEFRKLLGRPD